MPPAAVLASIAVIIGGVLTAAREADAATISKIGTTQYRFLEIVTETENNDVSLLAWGPTKFYVRDTGDSTTVDSASGCDFAGTTVGPGVAIGCPTAGITSWEFFLGAGNDALRTAGIEGGSTNFSVIAHGRAGNDTIAGGDGNDTINGDEGNDTINGGAGNDSLGGGADDDSVTGGPGDDGVIQGGTGTDRVIYDDGRSTGVNVTLADDATSQNDGGPEDGAEGARETVLGFENVVGTPGADSLTGNSAANVIDAKGGDDVIDSRDSVADTVDCGPGTDQAFVDSLDFTASCEPLPVAGSGGSSGTNTTTTTTGPAPSRLIVGLTRRARARNTATTFSALTLTRTPAGSLVRASCRTRRGARCRGVRDFRKSNARGSVSIRSFLKKAIPVGAKLDIRVTRAGAIGAVRILTIRRGKAPSLVTRCLPPGARAPVRC